MSKKHKLDWDKMNKRDAMILKWAERNRSDLVDMLEEICLAGNEILKNLFLLLSIGFEAGRQFQKENSNLKLGCPNDYLPDDPPDSFD